MLKKIILIACALPLFIGCDAIESEVTNSDLSVERIAQNTWSDLETRETYMIEGENDSEVYALAVAALNTFEVSLQDDPSAQIEHLVEVYSDILYDLDLQNPELADSINFRLLRLEAVCKGGGSTCTCSGSCTADDTGCSCN